MSHHEQDFDPSIQILNHPKSPPNQSQESYNEPSEPQWGVHWFTPSIMILTFVLGVIGGVGNDTLYQYLVDREVKGEDQQWYTRAGTAIAFLSKTLFAASIGISHRQRIWTTLRRKYITIGGIDALFGATVNPLSFLSLDMLLHAKLSVLMAILFWLLPISAVVAPATLSVGLKDVGPFPNDTYVPNLNLVGWGNVSTTTSTGIYDGGNFFASTLFNIENGESSLLSGASLLTKKLVSEVAYGGNIAPFPSPCSEDCEYTIEFHGPTLSCQQQDKYGPDDNTVDEFTYPNKFFPPQPGYYKATLSPVINTTSDGKLGLRNRLLVNAYSSAKEFQKNGLSTPDENLANTQNVICTPYNATYTVHIAFSSGIPVFRIEGLKLLLPINETIIEFGGRNGSDTWPLRGVIDGVYGILLGEMHYLLDGGLISTNTTITNTRLGSGSRRGKFDWDIKFVENLHIAIEELSHNVTLSLLSITDLTTLTTSQYTTTILVFRYSRRTLLWTYLVAAVAALFCIVVGLQALWANGISSDISFSRMLVTTRNPSLDCVSYGACLGGDPFPKNLRKTRLRFGEISQTTDGMGVDVAHAGFGTREVIPLRKGEKYL